MLVSFQFEDSEDDFDRFDTDDELSYRRDSVYSCVTLPYFHSFLFIKGNYSAPLCLAWWPGYFSGVVSIVISNNFSLTHVMHQSTFGKF